MTTHSSSRFTPLTQTATTHPVLLIDTLTNVARILVQDVADVFGVIEQRGLED
ncbi:MULTISPECIES: hypothetical protein [Pseudomonas]|uniref:hypothetical protein n=1 Tax=Pseudomonas TaxID=286 RepID=UPI000B29F5B7|nr:MULTISPECIES: hypothetical protein [Pseudomonas]QOD67322.1 hypothetical protein GFU70_28695 [Pseudomonas brassicacearum]